VVSALTALPDLQQLTWREMGWGQEGKLSDSRLLWQLTRLTSLELQDVAAEALQHLSSLTKLQRLSTHSPPTWAAADYPGLQELQALTSLVLKGRDEECWALGELRLPACVSQLTALQQLEVSAATATELNALTALTPLTKLVVAGFNHSSQPSAVLRLPALQHLNLSGDDWDEWPALHISYLASCKQLRYLSLGSFVWTGPGSLVASSMLQELDVWHCSLGNEEDGPAAVSPWERLFPGPGRLPHLTSLVLQVVGPDPQQAGIEQLVECCSGLRVLRLDSATDEQCSSLAQLTGLQDLYVTDPRALSAAGLRHLARLEQLTSLKFLYDLDSSKVSAVLIKQLSDSVVDCKHAIVNKVGFGHWVVECSGCLTTTSCCRTRGGSHIGCLVILDDGHKAGRHADPQTHSISITLTKLCSGSVYSVCRS